MGFPHDGSTLKPEFHKMHPLAKPGKITISMTQGGSGDTINITVVDEDSQTQFLDLTLGMEEFAYLLSGQARIPCYFELRRTERVGKVLESNPRAS